jgi:hypothetical protein
LGSYNGSGVLPARSLLAKEMTVSQIKQGC